MQNGLKGPFLNEEVYLNKVGNFVELESYLFQRLLQKKALIFN